MGDSQGDNNAGGAVERVTIAEAADLLGCHPNTVRSRVKAGIYRAEKVHTENGLTWMIDRDSLTTNTPTSATQQAVSGVPAAQQEAIQELARAIVREAGMGQYSDEQVVLETRRAEIDRSKSVLSVKVALLAAMGVVAALLPEQGGSVLLLWMLVSALISIATELLYMGSRVAEIQLTMLEGWYARRGRSAPPPTTFPQWFEALLRRGTFVNWALASGFFALSLLFFALYIYSKLS